MCTRFIGFTFYRTDNSIQGIQNTLFAIFMQAVVYPPLVFQIIPKFAANRELYEVRERASKTYAWPTFLMAQSIAEIPYQILMGCIVFAVWNYTVLGIQSFEQQGLVLLFMVQFFVWAGTIAQMVISAIPLPEVAGMVSVVLFALSLLFSGVIQPPTIMPHFWRFLWHVSPLAHWTAGIAATALHGRKINCATAEFATFEPASGSTCGAYLKQFLNQMHAPGYVLEPNATSNCQYCAFREADQILAQSSIFWADRWANFGYGMVYIIFNILMTVVLYKAFRLGGLGSKLKARRQAVLEKLRRKFSRT
jgi:ATP-binding cassette, subfamily G (WHITE), member 2, PDR